MYNLPLESAQAQWHIDQHDKQWCVVSKGGEQLWLLPADFTEKDVMCAIRMGREFELKAFNVGIQFGKEAALGVVNARVKQLESQLLSMIEMNKQLSDELDRHISGN